MWSPALTFYIYTWLSWHYFQCYFHHSKLKFIVINAYEHLKLIDSNHHLNPVKSFRTHCSSYSYVSYHPPKYCWSASRSRFINKRLLKYPSDSTSHNPCRNFIDQKDNPFNTPSIRPSVPEHLQKHCGLVLYTPDIRRSKYTTTKFFLTSSPPRAHPGNTKPWRPHRAVSATHSYGVDGNAKFTEMRDLGSGLDRYVSRPPVQGENRWVLGSVDPNNHFRLRS